MLFWLFALLLLASVGIVGFNMGAIRAAISFVGLILASLLAFPIGHFLGPIISFFGIKDPILLWAMGPAIVFVGIMIAVKCAAMGIHQKVDIHYKYKVGELRLAMWERVNHRLGLPVGLANGAIYLIVLSMPIYVISYATFQLQTDDNVSWIWKTFNFLGAQMDASGMDKIAASIDPMPESYYDATDIIGLVYHNDLLEGRLSRYPGFLSLGERPEFQAIATDAPFSELRQKQPPFGTILDQPNAQVIVNNPDMLKDIWHIAEPDLKDLQAFLKTGVSSKYDKITILGRWTFDQRGALNLVRRANPNITQQDIRAQGIIMAQAFSNTTFVASPDKTAIIKNYGTLKPAPRGSKEKGPIILNREAQNIQGHWESSGGDKYQLSAGSLGSVEAVVEGDTVSITGTPYPLRFTRD